MPNVGKSVRKHQERHRKNGRKKRKLSVVKPKRKVVKARIAKTASKKNVSKSEVSVPFKKREAKMKKVVTESLEPLKRKRGRPRKEANVEVATAVSYEKFGQVAMPKNRSQEPQDQKDYGGVGEICHIVRTCYGFLGCFFNYCGTVKCKARRKNVDRLTELRNSLQNKYGFVIMGGGVRPPASMMENAGSVSVSSDEE